MNREETLALFARGRDAWNAWANGMLAEREELERQGLWEVDGFGRGQNEASREWLDRAHADFREHEFGEDADFAQFRFPGGAGFNQAIFSGIAWFPGATFSGSARFNYATFSDVAWFDDATFSGIAWFLGATFSGSAGFERATFAGVAGFERATFSRSAGFLGATFSGVAGFERATFAGSARFDGATFSGVAGFELVTFESMTRFDHAVFKENASFAAVDSRSAFSLAAAWFARAPDFVQAHFAEAPRLDDVAIAPWHLPRRLLEVKNIFRGRPEQAARWRALKRLAVQGHDHAQEQEFFKRELLARRWNPDHPLTAVFWAGLLYGLFSDFGRSIMLPLLWLGLGLYGFMGAYLMLAQPAPEGTAAFHETVSDSVGGCDAPSAALHVSLTRTPFAPAVSHIKEEQALACLYGAREGADGSRELAIPDAVSWLGVLQFVFSAAMLFLFLLGVRNHFRIR